tara:strand:- start:1058 stop:1759 length:702 start_codon:yes stop_codon:yes gene_type:complete
MENNPNFKVFLYASKEKFIISVQKKTPQKIYREELISSVDNEELTLDDLNFFLEKHIFKIEKKLENFVKKIYLILDSDDFFPLEISLKKNNYENVIDLKNLSHLLKDGKDYCKKTIGNRKIVHMIIDNYQIGDEVYKFLPEDLRANSLSVNIKFICISNELIKNFEKILKKYQISLGQVVNAKYVSQFMENDKIDIFIKAEKIMDGHNPNEVMLVDKTLKKQGFFEKFFNFFN